MAKRDNGEGSLFYDKTLGLWRFQISYIKNGKRKRKAFTSKKRAVAKEKGQAFQQQLEAGYREENIMTVGRWISKCMRDSIRPRVRARTYEKYQSCMKNYILPVFDNRELTRLGAEEIQQHFNALLVDGGKERKGLSSSTVRATRRYFAMIMDEAVRAGLIERNPVKLTRPPKLEKKEIVVITSNDVEALVAEASRVKPEYMGRMLSTLIAFTAHTGLRQGEVFGLRWSDIDYAQQAVYVRRSLARVIGKGAIFQDPKTRNSRRRVSLMQGDIEMLRAFQDYQRVYAEELGDMFRWQDLVFTSTFGCPISETNFNRRYFAPLLKRCHIPEGFTFHGLRHTHATLLLQQGVNPKIVQERLGHSSIKVTMDTYSHVLPDMQQAAVSALEELFQVSDEL